MDGEVQPPQMLSEGTSQCHPGNVEFAPTWHIWRTTAHWSTSDFVDRYVKTILTPWLARHREQDNLPADQKGLLMKDVYGARRTPDILETLDKAGWRVQFVPACCTGRSQPLNISVNAVLKSRLTDGFTEWYTKFVEKALKEHDNNTEEAVESVNPDLWLSVLKPTHAHWVMDMFAYL